MMTMAGSQLLRVPVRAALSGLRRPPVLAGLGLAALSAAIIVNALFLQSSRHPAPLFAPHAATGEMAAVQPAAPAPGAEAGVPAAQSDPGVLAVQQALSRAAYGPLEVDGVMGRQTREAIAAFQRDHGLPETGEITDSLIVELRAVGALDGG
jgi:hypothetical protein